jgi:hypothetical protein
MTENDAPHTADDEAIGALWARACEAWTRGDAWPRARRSPSMRITCDRPR